MKKSKKILIWVGGILAVVLCIILLQLPTRETDIKKYLQGHGNFDVMAQRVFPPAEAFSQAQDASYTNS